MTIAYIALSQGGLGLMDATARTIPDFVLTMSKSFRYASEGFSFNATEPPHMLCPSLCSLFDININNTSIFLRHFWYLLPDVSMAGTHHQCSDPIDFFLRRGSLKSARDRLKKIASIERRVHLERTARPGLKHNLSEILIASSSYPILGMSRSIPSHRRPNDLFIINLKMKLYLELFEPSTCPTCLCGATIDVFGMHTFCCRRVSKRMMHDRIRDDTAAVLCKVLKSAQIIGSGSRVDIEPKRTVVELLGLRPYG